MKKLKFLSVLTLIAMLFTMAVSAVDIYSYDFEECDNNSDLTDADASELFESVIGAGAAVVKTNGSQGMCLEISGISEFRTIDVLEGEYVFSLDYVAARESNKDCGEGVFIKGVIPGVVTKDNSVMNQPANQSFNYYEADWYTDHTGKTVDSMQIGGSGIYVQLRTTGLRVNIKTYVEDGLNISQSYVDIAYPEGVTFEAGKSYNIKFYDEGSKVTIFLNNEKMATVDLSEGGDTYDDVDDYEYYGKAIVSNAAGEQILTVENTRVSSLDSQLAVAARAQTICIDNIKLYVGDDAVETDMNGGTPPASTETTGSDTTDAGTDAGTTDAGATDTTAADTTVADTTVADTTASDTATDDGEGSSTALIIGIIAGVVVVAAVVAVVVMKKKK